jgi:hypothetical protein
MDSGIDWAEVAHVTTVLQGISVTIASCAAIYGINAWRRKHSGKKRIDIAHEMLVLFFRAREALSYIRGLDGYFGPSYGLEIQDSPMGMSRSAKIP